MTRACDLIRAGNYAAAERIVKPIATKLKIAETKYWKAHQGPPR